MLMLNVSWIVIKLRNWGIPKYHKLLMHWKMRKIWRLINKKIWSGGKILFNCRNLKRRRKLKYKVMAKQANTKNKPTLTTIWKCNKLFLFLGLFLLWVLIMVRKCHLGISNNRYWKIIIYFHLIQDSIKIKAILRYRRNCARLKLFKNWKNKAWKLAKMC